MDLLLYAVTKRSQLLPQMQLLIPGLTHANWLSCPAVPELCGPTSCSLGQPRFSTAPVIRFNFLSFWNGLCRCQENSPMLSKLPSPIPKLHHMELYRMKASSK